MIEEWKDIKGYEGMYQISNLGRVKSCPRFQKRKCKIKGQTIYKTSERYVNPYNSCGYLKADLYNYWKRERKFIHRLIAQAFIPNPLGRDQINHKNGIRNDNRIENLEWVNQSENTKHAYWVLNCRRRSYNKKAA